MKAVYHKPSKKFLEAICKPECLVMGPMLGPSIGAKIPLYYSLRKHYSSPGTLKIVAKEMARVVDTLRVEAIAAIESAAIPWATALSLQTKKPMVLVRKEKRSGARSSIEGKPEKFSRYVLIDDALVGGAGKKRAVSFIEEVGGKVTDILVILNAIEIAKSGYDLGRNFIKEKGISLHYFMTWLDWFRLAHKKKYLSKELLELIEDAASNLKAWQDDEKKWQWLEKVKKAQGGGFI